MKEEHMLYKENDEERLDSPSLIMNFHNDKVTLSEVKRNYYVIEKNIVPAELKKGLQCQNF